MNSEVSKVEKNVYDNISQALKEWEKINRKFWMDLYQDNKSGKIFLTDWKQFISANFDDIKEIKKEGDDLYFIWINDWKSVLYKNWKAVNLPKDGSVQDY